MIFRRMIYAALFVGCIAGLVLSAAQITTVDPILFAAEGFESNTGVESSGGGEGHDHGSHDHGDGWSPADGAERTLFTILANISAGIGFAAILLALMNQVQTQGLTQLSVAKGALWGVGGFLAVFVAPVIGLPPEIPGIQAAAVESRQLWWSFAVVSVGLGLLCLSFAPLKYKAIGLIAIAMPYLVPIPRHDGPAFLHPDPSVVASLTELHQQFIVASALSNGLFWLALGVTAAWTINRWITADANH